MDRYESTNKTYVRKRKKIPKDRLKEYILAVLPRIVILVIAPLGTFLFIRKDLTGLSIGFVIGLSVILIEILLGKIRIDILIVSIIGGILGFIVSKLIDYLVIFIDKPEISEFVFRNSIIIKLCLVYIGIMLANKKYKEVELLDKELVMKRKLDRAQEIKILDTSTIIDGRIVDICSTKFLEGNFVVPRFVLSELHELADSEDHIKRLRGKRGLEMLTHLQSLENINLKIFDKDYHYIKGVDNKLIQLAKEYRAKLITTDYNLNRVATIQGITVLNINDLANTIKQIFLPGDSFKIDVIKEGKNPDQGVGYLDDGTMVVIEDGKRYIGKKIEVVVTSTLQTSSGRIVFTQVKS